MVEAHHFPNRERLILWGVPGEFRKRVFGIRDQIREAFERNSLGLF